MDILHVSALSVLSCTAQTGELLSEKLKNQKDKGLNSQGNSLLSKLENKTIFSLKKLQLELFTLFYDAHVHALAYEPETRTSHYYNQGDSQKHEQATQSRQKM